LLFGVTDFRHALFFHFNDLRKGIVFVFLRIKPEGRKQPAIRSINTKHQMERKSNPLVAARYFPRRKKTDTVRNFDRIYERNDSVLTDAYNAWVGLEDFRRRARRNERYVFGDQWGDVIQVGCDAMTERESIKRQENIPLQNNRIRGIIRSVTGVFQSQQTEPVCVARDRDEQGKGDLMSTALQYVYQLNKLWSLDGMNFNYFLITGLAAFKSTYGWLNNKMDVWTHLINPNNLFFDNHMNDPLHRDCHLIGEIHEVGLYDAMDRFSEGSPQKAEEIRNIYSYCDRKGTIEYIDNLTRDRKMDLDFFVPSDETRCRVIEVWRKESKERLLVHDSLTGDFYKTEIENGASLEAENRARYAEQSAAGVAPEDMKLIEFRWFIDNYWYYYFLSPLGDVLSEGETPFWHESHPYSFRIYPFYNNRVYPFVSDFIDQQRYINRLIMLQDFVIRSSAKGVLAIDESSIPDGYTIKDIADEWAVFNGVILYTTRKNPNAELPKQIVSNSNQLGINDMLSIQLKLLEDISGVQGALQGKAPTAGTPAALYMQQVQNSTTSLTELFESYRDLREERDSKNMKLIQQYYTEPRYINITGKNTSPESILYDPNKVRNAEFDLAITESTATPAYRLVMNDFLMQLFSSDQITLNELLENGAFPFADKLLASIRSRQREQQGNMQQGAMPGGQQGAMTGGKPAAMTTGQPGGSVIDPNIRRQIDQNVNPVIQKMLNTSSRMQ